MRFDEFFLRALQVTVLVLAWMVTVLLGTLVVSIIIG